MTETSVVKENIKMETAHSKTSIKTKVPMGKMTSGMT
jgi:hypothetical protein